MKKTVQTTINFVKKHKVKLAIIVGIMIVVIIYFFVRNGDIGTLETQVMQKTTVRQIVEETGVIKPVQEATLSFEATGVITSLLVKKGDTVKKGDVLAKLGDAEYYANILSAQSQLKIEEANLDNLLSNTDDAKSDQSQLDTIISQQEINVSQAYQKFLNNDLQAYPEDEPERETSLAPTVSGTYQDLKGGQYILKVYPSGAISGSSIDLSGLEGGIYPASVQIASPLGTKGLYLKFSGTISPNKTWIIDIPNTRSSTYLTALNEYKVAEASKEFSEAQIRITPEQIRAQTARVEQAQAAVINAEAQLNKRTIRAPFSGLVTDVHKNQGEYVSDQILSLISNNSYEIIVNITEADIANVSVGDTARIRLDAYEDEVFEATVTFIPPRAILFEGVSVFEITLQFNKLSERIRAGLSADVEILATEHLGVLAVPNRAIVEKDIENKYVRMIKDKALVEVPIITGLRGSEGLTEITKGLKEGDKIITFISKEALSKYDKAK